MNRLITIVGIFVIALVLGLLLVSPKYQSLQVLRTNVKEKENELQSKQDYFSQVKEAVQQLAGYEEPLAKIASALPDNPALASLLNFLQQNSAKTGLILKKVTLSGIIEPKEKGGLKEFQMTIELLGSYQALKDFILVLETSSRMIKIGKVSIDIPLAEDKEAVYKLDIKTSSY